MYEELLNDPTQTVEDLEKKIRDIETILDAAPIMIAYKSADDHFVSVNSAFADFVGLPKENIPGMTTYDLVEQHSAAQKRRDSDLEVLRTGKPIINQLIKWSGRNSKKELWMLNSTLPFYNSDGDTVGTVSYVVDVDDRIRAENDLQFYLTIMKILNSEALIADATREIVHLIKNHTGFDAVGIRLENGIDYPYCETAGFSVDFVESERFLCPTIGSEKLRCDNSGEPLLECMCGNIVCGRTDPAKPFFTDGGSFWTNSMTGFLQSMTETDRQALKRNRCNAEGYESVALIPIRANKKIFGLLQLNDHRPDIFTIDMIRFFEGLGTALGSTLYRKKAEDEHLKLERQLQLNAKLESLGVLAGGIAHDFNNLMGGIFGYIDMAIENAKDATTTSYLSKAIAAIDRARALTQQILTFAKGGVPIQQIGNLFPFVQETVQFALSGSNVSCNFDVSKQLWACNFDKNQIAQVINHIIINAKQAMPVGGTIELSASNITFAEKEHPIISKGNYVKISIKDFGVGIPKELLNRIFDPFLTTKSTGHGLGLSICHSILNKHGGAIDVESVLGKGSTFHLYLPATAESISFVPRILTEKHMGSGTFLIMDDEIVMRETISDMLASLGYTVVCKENGRDAVDYFKTQIAGKRTISGIIFDLTIPGGMGGKAAAEEIRKMNSEIPIFVTSGYYDDPVMKNPSDYGFTASICKPFRRSELSALLNTHLKV